MSYQFDGEFIEKFYLTFTMLAYESNRRFYPVGEVVGPMDKYKFTRNEVDMLSSTHAWTKRSNRNTISRI